MDHDKSYESLNRTNKSAASTVRSNCAVYVLHSNVRVFASAIAALSKLSDELYLRPQKDGICLKAFNKTRSAYGVFLFVDYFFSSYDTKSIPDSGAMHSRVSMKAALSLFKSAFFMEKSLVSCTLRVDCHGRELCVEFQQAFDVSRSFNVNIMERGKPFTSEFNKNDMENIVTINASEISSFLNEMRSGNEELMICVQNDKFVLQNYIPCADLHDASACRTEITLRPGRPLIVAVENDSGYSAEFTIATVEGDDISDDGSAALTQRPGVQTPQEEQDAVSQSSQCENSSHPNDLQSQALSQQSLPITQPTANDLQLNDEIMEIDEFRFENVAEQNEFEAQALCGDVSKDDLLCGQTSGNLNTKTDAEVSEATDNISKRKRSACPDREVNVEFQRRFLGIGVRKQHQSQASAMVNTIVEPTQFEMDKM
ncbi:hypothetical protein KIN20_026148 [Parelaphostrongylus tenuis]|uniref:Cell cycle checkpoint control protein n=1 Tax=Parelaphostrongylus tenuis TaxID=148309 RepID=A0AAD5QXH2_PARTN|nr:hypothetical protein KIN20_026148 [Parelaphostrongylus tenuis]